MAKKLEKLEKRTQRAIAELIRKHGLAGGVLPPGGDLAQAFNACSLPIQVNGSKAKKTAWLLQWTPPLDKRPVTLTEVFLMSHLPSTHVLQEDGLSQWWG